MRFKYYLRGAGIGVIVATLILSVAFLFQDNISDEEVIRRAMKLGMVMQENTTGTLADPPRANASAADLENPQTDQDPLAEPDQTGADAAGSADDLSAGDPDTQSGGETDDSPDTQSGSKTDDSPDTQSGEKSDGNQDAQSGGKSDGSQDAQSGGKSDGKEDTDQEDQKDNKDNKDNKDHKEDQTSDDKPSGSKSDDNTSKPEDNGQDAQSDEVEIVIESGDVSRMVSAKVFEAGLVDDAAEFNDYLGSNDYDNMLQPGTYTIRRGSSFREIARILTRQ